MLVAFFGKEALHHFHGDRLSALSAFGSLRPYGEMWRGCQYCFQKSEARLGGLASDMLLGLAAEVVQHLLQAFSVKAGWS